MSAEFSDPAWWPKPPPKPPKPISLPKVLFGTLLPAAAIGVAIFLIATHKSGSPAASASGRSAAAFEVCLEDQGALSPSERSNPRELQQDAIACRSHLPAGVALPDFTQQGTDSNDAAQREFEQCMQTASASIQRSRTGSFGVSSKARQAFRDAVTMCRSLSETGGGPAPDQTTTSTIPATA